ncbi:MAG: tetratricopeptide repeat protein [Terrimicrobiaceae bacterium]
MIDDHYKMGLMAAEGYLELGMPEEALREFQNLPRDVKLGVEGLTLLMEIHRVEEEWEAMESVAERLWEAEPENVAHWIDWAIALRLSNSPKSARVLLLEALEKFPEEALIHYHLACCECQLGNLPSAREHLMESKKRCRICRVLALTDEGELQPIWTDYSAPQFQS